MLMPAWAAPSWLDEALQEREGSLRHMDEAEQMVDELVQSLGIPAPEESPADDSMPESTDGETVGVSDAGIIFDKDHSRLVYLNNVRIVHPSLRLRCKERLYIQFAGRTLDEGKEQAKSAVQPGSKGKASNEDQIAPLPEQTATDRLPLCVAAGKALADAVNNRILLLGAPDLQLKQGDHQAEVKSGSALPARILADENGDIMLTGQSLQMQWKDAQGRPCRLDHRDGLVYYRADTSQLFLQGPTTLQTPDGSVSCTDEACFTLVTRKTEASDHAFMGQLTSLVIEGIKEGYALGNVVVTREATETQPASSVRGERMDYNGETGECCISGNETTLLYGSYSLATNGKALLTPEGDIHVQGSDTRGQYAFHPREEGQPALVGTYQTPGPVSMIAATGVIRLPGGLQASDDFNRFSCRGPLELVMQRVPDARIPDRQRSGMLNLAICAYGDIAEAHGTGGVSLHYVDKPGSQGLDINAQTADLDFNTGEALFTSSSGKEASVLYQDYRLAAMSDEGTSSLHLQPNGDLDMKGTHLSAALPSQQGIATATCSDTMLLEREKGVLSLGKNARVSAPDGRLAANGPLFLTLAPGEKQAQRPVLPRFPHLIYNYAGLQQAHTASGGALQTAQSSMQCTGPIRVELFAPGATQGNAPENSIRFAQAEGSVSIAAKDRTGRTMRATGDTMTLDGATGIKRLTGRRVTLQDAHNTHIASGDGAQILIDKNNNASISGARQSTSATGIRQQMEQEQQKQD